MDLHAHTQLLTAVQLDTQRGRCLAQHSAVMRPPRQICACLPCARAPFRNTCLPYAQNSRQSACLLGATCLPQCSEPGVDLLAR